MGSTISIFRIKESSSTPKMEKNSLLRNIIENFSILKFETKGNFEALKSSYQNRRRPMPQETVFEFENELNYVQ